MNITWHGQYTIKIISKETTIFIDPYAPSTGLKPLRGKAGIVALTNPSDSSMSHTSAIQGDPQIIDSPGEYSIGQTTLQAIPWIDKKNNEHSIHVWNIESITLLHLGALDRVPTDEELQKIEQSNIDIFFAPVGGGDGLDTKEIVNLIGKIEPRIIIPIHFKIPKIKEKLDSVDKFAKEMGISSNQEEKKLVIRASKLPQEDIETVILSP